MAQFRPELETCPICGAAGQCRIHAYYGRDIIDFRNGNQVRDNLCILRVYCDSCDHSHAILPDLIIPFSSYGLFFILRVLGEFFASLHPLEKLWEIYGISRKQFYKWLALWNAHKQDWLGILEDSQTSRLSFMRQLISQQDYSLFSQSFSLTMSYSFLQSHQNPRLKKPKDARYHQKVFRPDYHLQ